MPHDPSPPPATPPPDLERLKACAFDAAAAAVLLVEGGVILAASAAAEAQFGSAVRRGAGLAELPLDGPVLARLARRGADEGVAVRTMLSVGEAAVAAPVRGEVVVLTLPHGGEETEARVAAGLSAAAGMGRTLAHEVKNPLAGIRGAAQLLRADAAGEGVALAQLVIDEVDRIRRLVDRVEALSETRRAKRAPVNLHRVLARVRALAETAHGGRVRFRDNYDPSLPEAWGDEDQLVQVLLNLVNNASEAVMGGPRKSGEIVLSTAFRHGPVARSEDDTIGPVPLEVTVQDDGPGVPAALQPRLFDPFVTSKPNGEGLGLALAAKLVAQHDGAIDFESRPGRTLFRVRLPQAQRPDRKRSAA